MSILFGAQIMKKIYAEHNYSVISTVKYHERIRDYCASTMGVIRMRLKKPQPKCKRKELELKKKIILTLANFCAAELATKYSLRNQETVRAQKYSDFANDLINDLQIFYLLKPNLLLPFHDIKVIIKGSYYINDDKKLQLLSLMQ